MAVDISAYSLVACAKAAEPLMQARGGGSVVTMTYLGGVRAVPHYNVMGVAKATLDASMRYLAWDLGQSGIRVNAVSAGPVRTLAARSIAGFTTMEEMFEQRAPLHRQIDADDVGGAAAYLLSDDAANVTGTMLYVDAGYHAMGSRRARAPDRQHLVHADPAQPRLAASWIAHDQLLHDLRLAEPEVGAGDPPRRGSCCRPSAPGRDAARSAAPP